MTEQQSGQIIIGGQVVVSVLVTIVTYFIKKMIDDFDDKLERFDARLTQHETVIFNMNANIQRLIGGIGNWK